MNPIAKAAVSSALSFLVLMLAAAAVSVYAFDVYERAWGRGPSLQVLSWLIVPSSLGIGVAAAIGFSAGHLAVATPRLTGTVVGAVISVGVALAAIFGPKQLSPLILFPSLAIGTFAAAFAAAKLWPAGPAHAV